MLFTGWEARMVKNCDQGLENAARGRRPRATFSSPRSQFFTTRTDLKPANKGTGQNNYTRAAPTFGAGGGVLKDTTYLRTLPTTFYWLLNLS